MCLFHWHRPHGRDGTIVPQLNKFVTSIGPPFADADVKINADVPHIKLCIIKRVNAINNLICHINYVTTN